MWLDGIRQMTSNAFDHSELERAFPLRPYPKVTLHQGCFADDTLAREVSEGEWRRAAELDADRDWQSYSDEELIATAPALAHLPEESFVYYVPAYICFAATHAGAKWSEPGWDLLGSIVFSLTHLSPYNLARLKAFSDDQKKIVVKLLEFFASHESDSNSSDARKGLERYWYTDEANKPLIVVP